MEIELRFFRERYNMHPSYYHGDADVYCKLFFKTINELRMKWTALFEGGWLEGETYSAWIHGIPVSGGAFDPDDIDSIVSVYKVLEARKYDL